MGNIFAKVYNQIWVENIHNQILIKKWFYQNKLNKFQFEAAKNEFPIGFKHSNIFVKIGLFLFANISLFSAVGLISLFFPLLYDSSITVGILLLIYGMILFFVLNKLIPNHNFYRSGVDNALLYAILSCFFGFFLVITDSKLPTWAYSLIFMGLLSIALLKYSDLIVTVCLYGTWIFFWFNISSKFPIGKLILPFVIMIISAISYFLVDFWRKKEKTNYYFDSMSILEILTLITFYIGGNYYVVREGNAMLNSLTVSTQIAFAPLFYFFTVGLPIFYIIMGLKRHDRKMLIVGLLTAGFSIFTYHEYFSSLPIEWALTVGGIILIISSIFLIRYLSVPKFGLTYKPDSENKFQNLEGIVINQVLPTATTPDGSKFGGGDFGGAGASGEY